MKANTHCSPVQFAGEWLSLWNILCKTHLRILLAPIPSLSQNLPSPGSHLCKQVSLLNSVWKKCLKYYDNYVMPHMEIRGGSTLVQHNTCVYMYLCVYCKQKCHNIVCLVFFWSWLLQKESSFLSAACVRNTERTILVSMPFHGRQL